MTVSVARVERDLFNTHSFEGKELLEDVSAGLQSKCDLMLDTNLSDGLLADLTSLASAILDAASEFNLESEFNSCPLDQCG